MAAPPADLVRSNGGKIILLVIDGLGGLPGPSGATEMEQANIPNLDSLAARSSTGRVRLLPIGLTPGSGPGHLSLFGYDPTKLDFGRGLLEALGSEYPLAVGEIAARGNFCSVDSQGLITDRRAGRPSDEECKRLCQLLTDNIQLANQAKFILLPGKQHRFTLVLQGANGKALGYDLNDNDPQVEGLEPLEIVASAPESEEAAAIVNDFLTQAKKLLQAENANSMLLRGFSTRPAIDEYKHRYGLRAAGIAIYPMYRGVARLVGMDILPAGNSLSDQIQVAKDNWDNYDYFFIHTKDTDTAGHSGDFEAKVEALEKIDQAIPALEALGADVLMISGDHSTPTSLKEHSWHPVPLILHSSSSIPVECAFNERGVLKGDLGTFAGDHLTTLAMAHAGRLDKYGA